jgi:hypothetical protein
MSKPESSGHGKAAVASPAAPPLGNGYGALPKTLVSTADLLDAAATQSSEADDLARLKKEIVKRAGGALSAAEVSAQLNIPAAEVEAARAAGTLLAVYRDGHWTFPRAQFHDNRPIAGLAAFIMVHKGSSPWVTLDAFTAPIPC